ncbi:MAG: histidine kinase [Ignavibacteriaceae bacterium]
MKFNLIYKNKAARHSFIFSFCITASLIIKWMQTGNPFQATTVLFFFTVYIISLFSLWYASRFFKYFFKRSANEFSKKAVPALLIFWIGELIFSSAAITFGVFWWFILHNMGLASFKHQMISIEARPALQQFALWVLIGTIMYFYMLWRQSLSREQKLREEKLTFQYETLKSQVNPHFLFNSLNTHSSLVSTSTESAEQFINRLSSIYRYILENIAIDAVPLKSEISFVNDFFFLYKIRNEEKVNLDINISDDNGFGILPISLQMLIENAMKHNIATRERPLNIKIFIDDCYIVVENNLQKITSFSGLPQNGLKNLGGRIKLMTGKDLIVKETPDKFTVKLPLIKNNEITDN